MTKPSIRLSPRRSAFLASLSMAALIAASAAHAGPTHRLNIPAGSLEGALVTLANQTHEQVFFTPDVVAGRRAPALHGHFTAEQALVQLLGDSRVQVRRAGPTLLVLTSGGTRAAAPAEAAAGARPFGDDAAGPPPEPATPTAAARNQPETLVSEVEVTGSHLRGVADGASPVLVLGRTDLQESGHVTLAAALAALPQNFAGSANEGAVTSGTDRAASNANYATGVNLRGLGSSATLTLVNGRRMAGSGVKGDFADLSTLPASAVERVEILLDGASALYGSDAVGGVVNVILRRDFEGAETQLTGGAATAGEPYEVQLSQLVGGRWAGGGAWLSYELYRRGALGSADRSFTASADLRPLGGADHRLFYAHPGTILRFDPVLGANVPGFAIPAGQSGVGLRPSDFIAGGNLGNQRQGLDILPEQTRNSLYLSAHQSLGSRVEATAEARWGYRRYQVSTGAPFALLAVTRSNPFFVSPTGAASHQIAYSFVDDLPPVTPNGSAESLGLSLGADVRLPGDWRLQAYGAFAQEIGEQRTFGTLNTTFLNEALGVVPDRADTAFRTSVDGFFNPFTGAGANPANILTFIAQGFSNSRSRDRVTTASAQADGSLFDLPGGPLRLAIGVQARREAFFRTGATFNSGVAPRVAETIRADRTVLAGFAEARAPLVGPANARPGLERLELSLAARIEDYDDVGRTAVPKVGVIWSPGGGATLRASYGRSFRAPGLRETRDAQDYSPSLLPVGATRVLSLIQSGGNPELKPETATSWSAGIEWAPPAFVGLRLGATWFETRFRNRIDQPTRVNILTALTDPALASFVQRIAPTTKADDRALIAGLLASPFLSTAQGVFPPESYGAIVDSRYVNTGSLRVEGVDLLGAYDFTVRGDAVRVSGNASYLLHYDQQLTPTGPTRDFVGIANYPVRLRARLVGDWRRGPYGVTAAVNYIDDYRDALGVGIAAQATADLQLRWTAPDESRMRGLRTVLAVRNLFARKPPFYDSAFGLGYDPSNADPVGRFLSLQLTRSW